MDPELASYDDAGSTWSKTLNKAPVVSLRLSGADDSHIAAQVRDRAASFHFALRKGVSSQP